MVTGYVEEQMAKKKVTNEAAASAPDPPGKRRAPKPTKIAADLATKMAVISNHRDQPAHALLDPLIRAWIEAEYARAIRELARELDG